MIKIKADEFVTEETIKEVEAWYEHYKIEIRIRKLENMHKAIIENGDEDLYMTWVTLAVPDCPSREDFKDMARDQEMFKYAIQLYNRLMD